MIMFKPAAALLALGISGWVGMALQGPTGVSNSEAALVPAPTTAAAPGSELPDYETLRSAAETALRERVAQDLDDPAAGVTLPAIAIERTSLRSLEARGEGTVTMPGARAIPVTITAVY